MKKSILLVGKDQPLWREWRSVTTDCQVAEKPWEAQFANSGAEALALSSQFQFDAVVADIALADMNGVDLLDQMMERYPGAVRVAMSDIADMASTVKCIGKAH